jgi:D-amino peptidase
MKVYISIDMEGVAGVATVDQIWRGGHGYPRSQALMTGEANAAITGAFEGGADTVVINDSHGTMDNLLHEDLDPRAHVIFGAPKLQCMVDGLLPEYDVALFVGYHAPAGGPGVLAHTFSPHFLEVRLDGRPVSEAEINALYAASLGVPVGLVTGDEIICDVAEANLEGVVAVPVKKPHGWSATDSLSPSAARDAIRLGAAQAVASAGDLRPAVVAPDLVLEIDMPNTTAAELAEQIPGAKRTGNLTVSHETSSVGDIIGFIVVSASLAHNSMVGRKLLWGES